MKTLTDNERAHEELAIKNRHAVRKAEHLARISADLANAERDDRIRIRFHAWLESEGFKPQSAPQPGGTYPGAHTQTLWECYRAAVLTERGSP